VPTADSTLLELGLAAAVCLATLLQFLKVLRNPSEASSHEFAFLMVGFVFGGGPCIAFVFGGGKLPQEEFGILFYSYLAVLLFLLGTLAGPILMNLVIKKPEYREKMSVWRIITRIENVDYQWIAATYVGIWVLRMFIASKYGILFSGTGNEERVKELPYWISATWTLFQIIILGAQLWVSTKIWSSTGFLRVILVFTMFFDLCWSFTQGRRWLVEWWMIVMCGVFIYHRKLTRRQIIYGSITVALIFVFVFPMFIRMRQAYNNEISLSGDAASDLLKVAHSAIREKQDGFDAAYASNMSERPLIIRFICDICRWQETNQTMSGSAFMSSVIWTIPSTLYPQKLDLLPTEQYIQQFYGDRLHDTSITWPALGFADFGVVGGFIAGLIFGFLISLFEYCCYLVRRRHPLLSCCALAGLFHVVSFVDDDPVYMLSLFRTACLLLIFATIFRALTRSGDIFNPYSPRQSRSAKGLYRSD
jgi:hypothetical protein